MNQINSFHWPLTFAPQMQAHSHRSTVFAKPLLAEAPKAVFCPCKILYTCSSCQRYSQRCSRGFPSRQASIAASAIRVTSDSTASMLLAASTVCHVASLRSWNFCATLLCISSCPETQQAVGPINNKMQLAILPRCWALPLQLRAFAVEALNSDPGAIHARYIIIAAPCRA